MRLSRIYHPEKINLNNPVVLTHEKSHYLVNVLRHTIGQDLILFHESGKEYSAKIHHIEGKKKPIVTLAIHTEQITHSESILRITLIQGLAKNDKMDWIVQKAVELGVAEIYPVITEFSEMRLNTARLISKQAHWQNIAISAAEQSGRTCVPLVHLPTKIIECLPKIKSEKILCLHPNLSAIHLHKKLKNIANFKNLALLVGPEGGFAPKEITHFEQAGYDFVTLGPRILRTETAAIVMQSILQYQFGDIK